MLVIEYRDREGRTHIRSWHYSEPLPDEVLRQRALKITADGDELGLLLDAIRATVPPAPVTIDATPKGEGE